MLLMKNNTVIINSTCTLFGQTISVNYKTAVLLKNYITRRN